MTDLGGAVPELGQQEEWINWTQHHDVQILKSSKPFQQLLTHQKIVARFWEIEVSGKDVLIGGDSTLIDRKNLRNFAFPKIIDRYFKEKSNILELF